MRYQFNLAIVMLIFSLASCSKSAETSPAPIVTTPTTPTTPMVPLGTIIDLSKGTVIKQGTFSGNMGYTVSGTVKLYDVSGKYYLYFEDFTASNGPDLKVYLATTNTATQFVSLGAIKGNTGAQLYEITNAPDFNQYSKVLVWCQQFSVLFGAAGIR